MTSERKRRLVRGVYIAGAALLCVTIIFALRMAFSYDGRCGGLFPEVSAQRPCSLWTYMTGDVLAIAVVAAIIYWPVLLLLMVLVALAGYFFTPRGRRGRL